MALLWLEGYEGYGTTTDTDVDTYIIRRYPVSSAGGTRKLYAGRFGGYCCYGSQDDYQETPALTTDDTVVFGCAIRPAQSTALRVSWIARLRQVSYYGIGFELNDYTGEINVYRYSTLIATTSGANLGRCWAYVEFKVKCHQTEGTIDIRVNGVSVLSLSDMDTQYSSSYAYHDRLRIYVGYIYMDDIYFLDSTGSVNNDFLGSQKITGIFPNADSGTVEWTTSTGTDHYALVDETLDNDDTDYVEDTVSDNTDLWNYGSISGFDTIAGIQVNTTVEISDSTPYDLLTPVKSNTAQSDGGSFTPEESYTVACRVVELDPDTSSAWSVAGVNAIQCGVKVA